ncbi:e2e0ae8e-1058-4f8a-8621-260e8aa01c0c [Sclerotinia trifoliorum]|uniref:E2e0ae8e-1058-4f8a-8621-260e8aa01c0c n=1 Tax=Sclerotinia trifoliorum TaxID=28548 RepID=A0A8H2W1F9_9HELO|nr:e2e0ae8e-1058-4f8a-8621-260e8aa01c0c [Sclerotinia trifoliorum]
MMESTQSDFSSFVYSWLAATPDLFDPTDVQTRQASSSACSLVSLSSSSLSLASPSSSASICHSASFKGEVLKRKRSMNNEAASNSGSGTADARAVNSSSEGSTPPSSRQRSSNLARQALNKLRLAKPPVLLRQPDVRVEQPPAVRRLIILMTKASSKVIPHSLQDRIRAVDPHRFEVFEASGASDPLFEDPAAVYSDSYINDLWRAVDEVYNEARFCSDHFVDEAAWMRVVDKVLKSAELGQDSSMLALLSIQTQAIDPVFVPKHPSQVFAKKVDLAFIFSLEHPTVATAIEPLEEIYQGIAFSQMADAYTSRAPMVCCLEVKACGGDSNEALLQFAIWCAAGLERLRGLWELNSERDLQEELPPFLGWTVVGHDWKFHISWKDSNGRVTVFGPCSFLNAGTGSHVEIFVLIALIRQVKRWLEEEYWTWLYRNVLDGLK